MVFGGRGVREVRVDRTYTRDGLAGALLQLPILKKWKNKDVKHYFCH